MPSGSTTAGGAPGTSVPPFSVTPEMFASVMNGQALGGAAAGMSPEMVSQMLSDPLMQQQMALLAQNPEMLRAMVNSPLLNNVPGVEAMRSHPEVLARMMQPENIRAMLQLQQAFGGMAPPPAPGAAPTGGSAAPPPQPFAFPAFVPPPQPSTQELETRYAAQLAQLEDMGFTDRARNLRALSQTQGNVQFAVERLLQ